MSITDRYSCALCLLAILLAGCTSLRPYRVESGGDWHLPARVELAEVPFFPQKEYLCGPAALATVLNSAGFAVQPVALTEQVYVPGRKGSFQVEMLAAARRHGALAYEVAPNLAALLAEVAAGTPVLVLEDLGITFYHAWHYAVLVGYDLDRGEVVLRSGTERRQTVPMSRFARAWQKGGSWAMLAIPPSRLPASAAEDRLLAASLALERTGQLDAARTAYLTLLARWPRSLAGRMGLGNTAYAMGRLQEAEAAFLRATLDHPESAAAFNNLAQTLADEGKYPEAIAAARHAVVLGGESLRTSQATLCEVTRRARQDDRQGGPCHLPE